MNLKTAFTILIIASLATACSNLKENNQREVIYLKKGWKFTKGDIENAQNAKFDDTSWETVQVPHDWAISGPYDKNNDIYTKTSKTGKVKVTMTGRTGALPFIGVGWYRNTFTAPALAKGKRLFIEFDGAMSHTKIYLNGSYIGEWPYGYSSFTFDLTDKVKFGEPNILAVRLENFPKMSRWYPGAGIYRNVRLVYTPQTHVAHWGTYITTPGIENGDGTVNIKTTIEGNGDFSLLSEIYSPENKLVKTQKNKFSVSGKTIISQNIVIANPVLWSIDKPKTYTVLSKILRKNEVTDIFSSDFGFRYIKFTADDGFHLNGKRIRLQGVCMHHDLGPIGAALNVSALHRQLRILKEMGCNAIRTSHNPPAPELLALCDTMGFVVMDEAFDEWKKGKVTNGYHTLWDEWSEKDLTAFIRRDRNHPSVVLWSAGNEIPEQRDKDSWRIAKLLVDICHREDSTRPVSIGMNGYVTIKNKFATQFDVKGWNYHLDYAKAHEEHPDWAIIASETQSTVESRGYYDTDAIPRKHYTRDNLQCSSYTLEYPGWANTPDVGFATLDDNPFIAGEFVWTGFDYLGESTPYNVQWPTRSSYFGIVDLCGLPKDMFYLYQQRWSDKKVLHVLPHWNWKEGQNVPVHVFTNYNSAELFVNGKSHGIRTKNPEKMYGRYRLVWDTLSFVPGELKVVALDKNGKSVKETIVETAGDPYAIKLISDGVPVKANGEDLAFIEVRIVDKEGRVCPLANNTIHFKVEGKGSYRASGNGDATDLEVFQSPERKCFYGKCIAIIQTSEEAGEIILTASSENLQTGSIKLVSQ